MKLTRGRLALIAAALACNALALVTSARSPETPVEVASEQTPEATPNSFTPSWAQSVPQPIAREELGARAPNEAQPETDTPQVLALAKYQPRPQGEWEGMLVDLANRPSCSSTERCAFGLSCKEGRCMPCTSDNECLQGEACVHDHCLPQDNVACKRRADCEGDSQCIITGHSATIRGNEDMRSWCVNRRSGASEAPNLHVGTPSEDTRTFEHEVLMQEALRALQER